MVPVALPYAPATVAMDAATPNSPAHAKPGGRPGRPARLRFPCRGAPTSRHLPCVRRDGDPVDQRGVAGAEQGTQGKVSEA